MILNDRNSLLEKLWGSLDIQIVSITAMCFILQKPWSFEVKLIRNNDTSLPYSEVSAIPSSEDYVV